MTEQREPDQPFEPVEGVQPVEDAPEHADWQPVPTGEEVDPRAVEPEWWQQDQPSPEQPQADEPTITVDQPMADEPTVAVDEPTVVADTASEPTFVEAVAPAPVEPTAVIPEAPTVAPTESIFRPASPNQPVSPTAEPTTVERLSEEEERLAAERAARRDARLAALAATGPAVVEAPAPVVVHKRTNDKFWGSLGLFLLRLVVAGIVAVRGMNLLTDLNAAEAMFAKTIIPEPALMALITGTASLLIALSLVLGLLTRLSGLGVLLIAGGALAFVQWGPWSPFIPGQAGFIGEFELLLAAVGLLFLLIGAGGWSLDRSFRAGRERDKAERAALAG